MPGNRLAAGPWQGQHEALQGGQLPMVAECHAVRELVEDLGITGRGEQARRYRLSRDHEYVGREKAKLACQFMQPLVTIAAAVDHKVMEHLRPHHASHDTREHAGAASSATDPVRRSGRSGRVGRWSDHPDGSGFRVVPRQGRGMIGALAGSMAPRPSW